MKVALQQKYESSDDRYQYLNWLTSLPFLENKRAVLIHRPRAVATVAKSAVSKYPYLIASMWCGNSMVNSEHWTFLSAPPEEKIVCARCESMAVLNGLPSSDSLVGHHVHIGGVKAVIQCCKQEDE